MLKAKSEVLSMFKNILAIGAHFDDVELGVGGTLAKYVKNGSNVFKLTLTDNETQFDAYDIYADKKTSKQYSKESCEILGITELTDFELQRCNHLQYSPELMQVIEKFILVNKIDTVFIHYSDDVNTDHKAASAICKTAARYCKNILMYSSNGYLPEHQFCPTVFVDITETMDLKKKALSCYKGDHNRFNRLFGIIYKKNEVFGYACQCEYAEAFVPIKVTF